MANTRRAPERSIDRRSVDRSPRDRSRQRAADRAPRPSRRPPTPTRSAAERRWLVRLGWATVVLGAGAAVVGLLTGPDPVTVTSVRGQEVELFGAGVYRYDSVFAASANRGTDLVTLVLAVPFLAWCLAGARRGSARARLLLPGAFAWFLYVYATMTMAAALNPLFVVHVGLFAASLFGGALAVRALDVSALADAVGRLPRRLPGWLMVVSGIATPVIWLGPVVGAQLAGEIPARLDTYTTLVTIGLDTATITPAALVAGALILRGRWLGYVMVVPLLVIESALAPVLSAQTYFQVGAGVQLAPGEIVGPLVGFLVLSGFAIVALVRLVRAATPRA